MAVMLSEWVAPASVAAFLQTHLQKRPHAAAGAAINAVPLLTWDTLSRVLGSPLPIDVVTVAGGRLVNVPRPRSLDDVRALMTVGISVVIRASETHDDSLAALAAAFSRVLPGEVHIQLYATPHSTNSYGWHYDFEDVFIAQTLGRKDYYFRDNTVARGTVLGDRLDFTGVTNETSPVFASTLLPGDWLYIPARWWHLVKCVEDSLSISIGVMPPEALRLAKQLPAGWSGLPQPR